MSGTGNASDGLSPDREGSWLGISRRGFHRLAYVEWGDPAAERVALCVHGLSRQGRDFDHLAAALAGRGWRVVCPDLVGRGRSDWLRDPDEYTLPQYAMDMTGLIARLNVPRVDWVGTSLGGLIGMVLAGQAKSPVARLVVNDIGPYLPWSALHRLANTVRTAPHHFPSLEAATAYFRGSLAPFGPLDDAHWHHLARHSVVEAPEGGWRKLFDPDIIASFRSGLFFNLSLWNYWDAITCPTLLLRGVHSDLLLASTAHEMQRRGPRPDLIEFSGVGHAPALMDPAQIEVVASWLEQGRN